MSFNSDDIKNAQIKVRIMLSERQSAAEIVSHLDSLVGLTNFDRWRSLKLFLGLGFAVIGQLVNRKNRFDHASAKFG